MKHYKYYTVSMAVVLRDHVDTKYIDNEHKMLVDIADTLYNAGLGPESLRPEYKALYDKYKDIDADYWAQVLKDISAIDSQVSDYNIDDLILDYNDYLTGAICATEGA